MTSRQGGHPEFFPEPWACHVVPHCRCVIPAQAGIHLLFLKNTRDVTVKEFLHQPGFSMIASERA
jgi:hypothetical protein